MNLKKKFFIFSLVFLFLICMSVVNATENTTDDNIVLQEDYQISYDNDNDGPEQAIITAKDFSSYYYSDDLFVVGVKNVNGKPIEGVKVNIKLNDGFEDYDYSDDDGESYFYFMQKVGTYKATISIDSHYYEASPINVNIKITKTPVRIVAKKITTTANKYAKLKVTVKDKWGVPVYEGKVKFIVNGKSYYANVKNGVATKSVKLTKAKTYTYKASFYSTNYQSKTVSSKVVVKKAPKQYYYKKGKYDFKVSENQHKKIQYVKNHKSSSHLSTYADFSVKTNQYYYGEPVYAVVTTWSGIRNGHYLNYPQVQFVVKYGEDTWDWKYLTGHYRL